MVVLSSVSVTRNVEVRINIGVRIRAERKAKDFSQADLERRCGLARCRISWLEHGRAVPTLETLERISDALGIPVYRLLYDGEEPAPTPNYSGAPSANGKRRQARKTEVRLLRELREHLSRMGSDDRDLLLMIARKMAGRGVGGLEDGNPDPIGSLDRTDSDGSVGRNS